MGEKKDTWIELCNLMTLSSLWNGSICGVEDAVKKTWGWNKASSSSSTKKQLQQYKHSYNGMAQINA